MEIPNQTMQLSQGGKVFLASVGFATWLVASQPKGCFGLSFLEEEANEASTLQPILDRVYNLQYDQARSDLEAWIARHPSDLSARNFLPKVILDKELLKEGLFSGSFYSKGLDAVLKRRVTAPPTFFNELNGLLDEAQGLEEQRLRRDSRDKEALYWMGVTYSTRSELDFTLKHSYLSALRNGGKARQYNLELLKQDRAAVDAYFVLGLADYVAGSLPWYLRALASMSGHHGTRSQGLTELREVSEKGNRARVDAKIVLATLYRRERMYPQAVELLRELQRSYPRNYLIPSEIADIYKAEGDWRAAAGVYDGMVASFAGNGFAGNPSTSDPVPAATILYDAGKAHEHLGDTEEASSLFRRARDAFDSSGRVPQ